MQYLQAVKREREEQNTNIDKQLLSLNPHVFRVLQQVTPASFLLRDGPIFQGQYCEESQCTSMHRNFSCSPKSEEASCPKPKDLESLNFDCLGVSSAMRYVTSGSACL